MRKARPPERVPAAAHAAAHDERVGVHGNSDGRECARQVAAQALACAHCLRVVSARGLEHGERVRGVCNRHRLGAVRLALLAIQADEPAGACVLLKAAAAAAVAGLGLLGLNVEVPNLACRSVCARDDVAADDNARAHARAQRHHDGAAARVARAEPCLAEGRRVRVVQDGEAGLWVRLAKRRRESGKVERDVGCHRERAVLQHHAGNVQADGVERARAHLRRGKNLSALRHEAHLYARAADVDAHRLGCLLVHDLSSRVVTRAYAPESVR